VPSGFRNRSGLKTSGSEYSLGSWRMLLVMIEERSHRSIRRTDHAFPKNKVPLGRWYPLYSSSLVELWTIPNNALAHHADQKNQVLPRGVTGCHRKASLQIAVTYGRDSKSSKSLETKRVGCKLTCSLSSSSCYLVASSSLWRHQAHLAPFFEPVGKLPWP
jgi:hypothetical protein